MRTGPSHSELFDQRPVSVGDLEHDGGLGIEARVVFGGVVEHSARSGQITRGLDLVAQRRTERLDVRWVGIAIERPLDRTFEHEHGVEGVAPEGVRASVAVLFLIGVPVLEQYLLLRIVVGQIICGQQLAGRQIGALDGIAAELEERRVRDTVTLVDLALEAEVDQIFGGDVGTRGNGPDEIGVGIVSRQLRELRGDVGVLARVALAAGQLDVLVADYLLEGCLPRLTVGVVEAEERDSLDALLKACAR